MDTDSWSARLSSASKRYQSALHSRSDLFMGFEEIEADDNIRDEYPCLFCSEYFDIVGLCCHIDDEHPVEAKNGLLYRKYKGSFLVNLLGKWKESEYSGQYVPVGGLAYYVTAPSSRTYLEIEVSWWIPGEIDS
ncbi:protein DEHYDRATION-INDUCED 19 homolog 6-like isoform X1 [Apium graveolens]|uniref:protein DEHYDRATION-INDUCED 19 homolog 6-like isoform X1 n=1 Tax=Apium graveolens TaxID=4045 RepID=UPI003D795990